MGPDVVTHFALHRARAANARAVHLHPTQLTPTVVATLRQHNLDVHTWELNDDLSLRVCAQLGVSRLCTDRPREALRFRAALQC